MSDLLDKNWLDFEVDKRYFCTYRRSLQWSEAIIYKSFTEALSNFITEVLRGHNCVIVPYDFPNNKPPYFFKWDSVQQKILKIQYNYRYPSINYYEYDSLKSNNIVYFEVKQSDIQFVEKCGLFVSPGRAFMTSEDEEVVNLTDISKIIDFEVLFNSMHMKDCFFRPYISDKDSIDKIINKTIEENLKQRYIQFFKLFEDPNVVLYYESQNTSVESKIDVVVMGDSQFIPLYLLKVGKVSFENNQLHITKHYPYYCCSSNNYLFTGVEDQLSWKYFVKEDVAKFWQQWSKLQHPN